MSDIAMCSGVGCPKKNKCYRHKAVPNEYWQSWMHSPWYREGKKWMCDYFIAIKPPKVLQNSEE